MKVLGRVVASAAVWLVLTVVITAAVHVSVGRRLPVISQVIVVCLWAPALVFIWRRPAHGR